MDEHALLAEFRRATGRAREEAFRAVVDRYVNVVYAAARRQVGGDAHRAEDVTQAVFVVLAQKAASVPPGRPLSAWLLKVTRYAAANARRSVRNRDFHEREAAAMSRAKANDVEAEDW